MSCVVPGCGSISGRMKKGEELSFHRFPKDECLRKLWLNQISIKDWIPKRYSVICCKHFTESSFIDEKFVKWRRLKHNAYPTLNLPDEIDMMFSKKLRVALPRPRLPQVQATSHCGFRKISCAVPNCTSKSDNNKKLSFYEFPEDRRWRLEWVDRIKRKNWIPRAESRLCSRHFTENCFQGSGKRRQLKINAAPTLNLPEESDFQVRDIGEEIGPPAKSTITEVKQSISTNDDEAPESNSTGLPYIVSVASMQEESTFPLANILDEIKQEDIDIPAYIISVGDNTVIHNPVVHKPMVHNPLVHKPAGLEPVVQDPVVQNPVVQKPVSQNPVVHKPVLQNPVLQNPVVQKPVLQNLVVQKPAVQKPVLQNPVLQNPVVQNPVVQKPVLQNLVVQKPAVQKPVVQKPVLQNPVLQNPVVQNPVVQKPVLQNLVVQKPAVQKPVLQNPVIQSPIVQKPVLQNPVVQKPVLQNPVVHKPVLQNPVVQNPVVHKPVLQNPVVQKPVVQKPVVQKPVVQKPVLQNPVVHKPVVHNLVDDNPVDKNPVDDNNADNNPTDDNTTDVNILVQDSKLKTVEIEALFSYTSNLETELVASKAKIKTLQKKLARVEIVNKRRQRKIKTLTKQVSRCKQKNNEYFDILEETLEELEQIKSVEKDNNEIKNTNETDQEIWLVYT